MERVNWCQITCWDKLSNIPIIVQKIARYSIKVSMITKNTSLSKVMIRQRYHLKIIKWSGLYISIHLCPIPTCIYCMFWSYIISINSSRTNYTNATPKRYSLIHRTQVKWSWLICWCWCVYLGQPILHKSCQKLL